MVLLLNINSLPEHFSFPPSHCPCESICWRVHLVPVLEASPATKTPHVLSPLTFDPRTFCFPAPTSPFNLLFSIPSSINVPDTSRSHTLSGFRSSFHLMEPLVPQLFSFPQSSLHTHTHGLSFASVCNNVHVCLKHQQQLSL